ncbi:MAG: alpha/beta fold hydrolase [Trueperaceae bacterium]
MNRVFRVEAPLTILWLTMFLLGFAQAGSLDLATLPEGFTSETVSVNNVQLHYVRGGQGEPVILLHGFANTWYMWRKIMPELAQSYDVIAVDLRGSGGSSAPASGYDKKTLAQDVHALAQALGLQTPRVVGHDIGLMVAYAYAAQFPTEVKQLVLLEAPIPDENVYSFPALGPQGPVAWQFGMFSEQALPEGLVSGREKFFLETFITSKATNKDAFTDADFNEYARHYADPAHLRASFEYFRTFAQDIADNQGFATTKLTMPILALGGENSLGSYVFDQAQTLALHVEGGVIPDVGHWIVEETPEEVTRRLIEFFTSSQ